MGVYIKFYIITHVRYWYIYVANLLVMLFAFIASLLATRYLDALTGDLNIMKFLSVLVFAVISSLLMWIPNITAARKYEGPVVLLAIMNQLFSFAIFYFIGYILYFG
ncbi:hypothetical protein SAMN04487943_1018 [Gracilibacillus orientalis]|uniref:Uncharacterized protein n=1 Tax=Gracilibacillus orientalis TaxID=334253 RepID=A0A1I4GVD1_9BACI|nr:hypothetical protein [Gracilibacillus orientalis]SFL33101.1 hypothetical protein SAMN04487943_1018 [Gracilibacillus orientalis]